MQLSRSWIHITEDQIFGVDQNSAPYCHTMFENFNSFSSSDNKGKQYGSRNVKLVKAKWDEVEANIPKFREALQFIQTYEPTGVTEN